MKRFPEATNPVIQVNGSVIALPLTDYGAEIIKQACKEVTGGNRGESATDTIDRHTWALKSSKFTLLNLGWSSCLDKILDYVCTGLNITRSVDAQLDRLLICEPGPVFQAHRGMSDEAGTIAFLVVLLPSQNKGRPVLVSHSGEFCTFDVSERSMFNTTVLAMTTNAVYDMGSLKSGRRLAITYHITEKKPRILDHSARKVENALRQCVRQTPSFSIKFYSLNHQDTSHGLSVLSLKGHDRAVHEVLNKLCPRYGLFLFLGSLKNWRTTQNTFSVDIFSSIDGASIATNEVSMRDELLNHPHSVGGGLEDMAAKESLHHTVSSKH
ncbi:hypothetical protein F4802DRAFT_612743 [Xylaria palmicola]|nr:hypothetical protein F4802DRAFT_612743 [Xylaria palmicola]